ncbi:50S ribosomal protein L11 methyltransferase [Desulfuromonas sp. KJ2020]|uniref:50S ribosomal protein L11 methyltransferase n=1 Tax=Desulfuromonas sp. KJ2020 TaxID=2919173 RepID=UPI0020A7073E|nr:50S ribosomal protein L11 methyltransferase [Desulfuromonas sp. KJ2020]MCP3178040.1 50S ribosomal protein L11 methyltransferase [Desulfuromonas sp. KJ2020]
MGREYAPFTIGHRFCITPPDDTPIRDDRLPLVMESGAFGSGEHETTASCLEILEDLPDLIGKTLLDLGSGTGILAIAALKLGASHALCVDIDPTAVVTCQHHSHLNGVVDKIDHLCGTLDQVAAGSFDLILANIYGDILLSVADALVSKAAPGAHILLSGMLWEYNYDVRQKYERLGCQVIRNRMLDEFSTVLMQKSTPLGLPAV